MKKMIVISLLSLFTILLGALVWISFKQATSNKIIMEDTQEKLAAIPESAEVATFAGGCFWCIENTFDNQEGVYEAVSGYVGGSEDTAQYQLVASGQTQHREAIQVYFNPNEITYDELLDIFWNQIDPTDPDGQFVDKGYQYTTAIYSHDDAQKLAAEKSLATLENSGQHESPIVTEILPFEDNFYLAEEYHQDYAKKSSANYERYKNGSGR